MTIYNIALFYIAVWRIDQGSDCIFLASFLGLALLLDISFITYLVRKFLFNTKLSCGEYIYEVPLDKFDE